MRRGRRANAFVVRTIVQLAKSLRLAVTAKGIETHSQAAELRASAANAVRVSCWRGLLRVQHRGVCGAGVGRCGLAHANVHAAGQARIVDLKHAPNSSTHRFSGRAALAAHGRRVMPRGHFFRQHAIEHILQLRNPKRFGQECVGA
jgi:hypothetical protein